MIEFYRKNGTQGMRPYIDGEDLTGVSLSEADKRLDTLAGGMIAVGANDHTDQWYVSKKFFEENYELVD